MLLQYRQRNMLTIKIKTVIFPEVGTRFWLVHT
jgi:hypothetical protein